MFFFYLAEKKDLSLFLDCLVKKHESIQMVTESNFCDFIYNWKSQNFIFIKNLSKKLWLDNFLFFNFLLILKWVVFHQLNVSLRFLIKQSKLHNVLSMFSSFLLSSNTPLFFLQIRDAIYFELRLRAISMCTSTTTPNLKI